jgi:hypothetical protein
MLIAGAGFKACAADRPHEWTCELALFKGTESDRGRLAKMRTSIGVRERPQTTQIERQFVRTANGHDRLWELAFLLTIPATSMSAMYERSLVLASSLDLLVTQDGRKNTRGRWAR